MLLTRVCHVSLHVAILDALASHLISKSIDWYLGVILCHTGRIFMIKAVPSATWIAFIRSKQAIVVIVAGPRPEILELTNGWCRKYSSPAHPMTSTRLAHVMLLVEAFVFAERLD